MKNINVISFLGYAYFPSFGTMDFERFARSCEVLSYRFLILCSFLQRFYASRCLIGVIYLDYFDGSIVLVPVHYLKGLGIGAKAPDISGLFGGRLLCPQGRIK